MNLTGLKMESPKIVRNKIHIKADFTATAYSAVEGAAKRMRAKRMSGQNSRNLKEITSSI